MFVSPIVTYTAITLIHRILRTCTLRSKSRANSQILEPDDNLSDDGTSEFRSNGKTIKHKQTHLAGLLVIKCKSSGERTRANQQKKINKICFFWYFSSIFIFFVCVCALCARDGDTKYAEIYIVCIYLYVCNMQVCSSINLMNRN